MTEATGKNQEKKKVGCLYRVSTRKQVNVEEDIPMQRNACMEYIKKKADWELFREYLEPGVSGYHKGLNDRKVLQEVIKDVGERRIDVLLVFMFDRIGRKDNETPFLLKRIVECGVEVWSVCEGQQTFENSSDNLMNIIRFWGANTESRKTAARVDSGRNYATKMGKFTGGTVAYGYRLVPTGRLDRKNRMINAFTKDAFESGVVQDIYARLIDHNMSLHEIAVYLNEDRQIRTRKGNEWNTSTLRGILRNPLYKGYMSYGKTRMKEVERIQGEEVTKEAFLDVKKRQRAVEAEEWILAQQANPDYVIVSEERWQLAQEILSRRAKKYQEHLRPAADRTFKSALLFPGLLECGYCHGRISPAVSSQKIHKEDGLTIRSHTEYYKCNTRAREKRLCSAKSYISRRRLEQTVLEEVRCFLDGMEQPDCAGQMLSRQKRLLTEAKEERERLAQLQREYRKVQGHIAQFKEELYKAVLGESAFDHKEINDCLHTAKQREEKIRKEVDILEKNMQAKQLAADTCAEAEKEVFPWREIFEEAPLNIKKKLLSMLIEKIIVTEGEIVVHFKINIESFLKISLPISNNACEWS